MYKFTIDTDSEKLSSVSIYADKEKTKRIAAPLDAVGRFAQSVKITFIGARKPSAEDTLQLVVSWDGIIDSILQSADGEALRAYIAHAGTPDASEPDTWTFPVKFESAALEAALAQKTKITLRGAVVVENEAAGTHAEYHFSIGAVASIFAGAVEDPQNAPIEFARIRRLNWADYQNLTTIENDVIYIIADAPEPLSKEEAAETFAQLREEIEENRGAIIAHGEQLEALAGLAADSETALGQVAASVPLLETVPAAGTSNADAYGYIGTLRDLGAFGGAVDVRQLTIYRRTEGTQANGSVALWARILKNVGGAWTVAAQSTHSIAWNDYSFDLPFTMAPVAGVTPPSADEKIAIVFVNSETAAASASNGTVSFRTVDGSGGFTTALGADANTASSNSTWKPRTKLRFAALPGAEECATKGDIEDLKTGNTYLLQRISALETRIAALEGA